MSTKQQQYKLLCIQNMYIIRNFDTKCIQNKYKIHTKYVKLITLLVFCALNPLKLVAVVSTTAQAHDSRVSTSYSPPSHPSSHESNQRNVSEEDWANGRKGVEISKDAQVTGTYIQCIQMGPAA